MKRRIDGYGNEECPFGSILRVPFRPKAKPTIKDAPDPARFCRAELAKLLMRSVCRFQRSGVDDQGKGLTRVDPLQFVAAG